MIAKCENCSRINKTTREVDNGSYTYNQIDHTCAVLEFDGARPVVKDPEKNCCDYFSPLGDPNPMPISWEGPPQPEKEVKSDGKRKNKRKD